MNADLLKTNDLCAALKTFLAAIDHPTLAGQKLFEDVAFHDDKSLADALEHLVVTKSRICLIVPAGDHFIDQKEARTIRSDRFTTLDLVIADAAYGQAGQEAVFGSANALGVLAMKDLILAQIAEHPQLTGLRWCALRPKEAAMLEVPAANGLSNRKAAVINYETPSGRIISPIQNVWPN